MASAGDLRGGTEPRLRVLFVGNSLTAANDLPGVVASLSGGRIVTRTVAPGGVSLEDHWTLTGAREAALSATTTRWATVTCSGCQTRSRVELPMPAVKGAAPGDSASLVRVARPGATAAELPSAQMPTNVAAVETMDGETMQHVFATLYVDEVAVAVREGGHALLREKLNTLSEGEKRVLREALSETAA